MLVRHDLSPSRRFSPMDSYTDKGSILRKSISNRTTKNLSPMGLSDGGKSSLSRNKKVDLAVIIESENGEHLESPSRSLRKRKSTKFNEDELTPLVKMDQNLSDKKRLSNSR